ncbi:MAG: VWA domain-containing protein [Coriobacteriia bacterium]|nr:VWA domain-containing protein [Coriobacteriia bacterium]
MSRRRTLAAVLAFAAALALGWGPFAAAQQASDALSISGIDTGAYPSVTLEVALPAVFARDDVRFSVSENGAAVKVLSASRQGAERDALRAVLVIDTSGSMAGRALADAKSAARAFVGGMREGDRIALVGFSDEARTVSGFTDDRSALVARIDRLAASGETALYDALGHAARLVRDGEGPAVIVVLSDGGDTVSASSLDAAVRALTAAGAPVYAVALQTREWDPRPLEAVARASGGRLLRVSDSGKLLEAYTGIAEEIANTWSVTFESGSPATKDLDLRVTATAGGRTAVGSAVAPNPLYAGPPPTDPGVRPGRPEPLLLAASVFAVFGSVALAAAALAGLIVPRRARLDRLAFYDQAGEEARRRSAQGSGDFQSKLVDAVGQVAGKRGFTRLFAERLQQAGLAIRPAEFMALHLLSVIVVGAAFALATRSLLLGVALAVVSAFVPLAWLDSRTRKRREAFEEQLPDVLDLIAGSLRAGWGLQQAIGLVVEQSAPPASVEFGRVQAESRLGLPVEQALEKMAERLGSEDFRWTVAAIAVQRDVGGNLAEVLDIVSATMRERAQVRRQVKALTAEGRLSAIVLIALPFVELVALLVISPGYMSLLVTTPAGWVMSALGLALMGIGVVWLNRVMTVEV